MGLHSLNTIHELQGVREILLDLKVEKFFWSVDWNSIKARQSEERVRVETMLLQ